MNNEMKDISSKNNFKEIMENILILKKRADIIRESIKCDFNCDSIAVSFSDKELDPWDLYYLICDVEQLNYLISKGKDEPKN
jgi:hypothetical protein